MHGLHGGFGRASLASQYFKSIPTWSMRLKIGALEYKLIIERHDWNKILCFIHGQLRFIDFSDYFIDSLTLNPLSFSWPIWWYYSLFHWLKWRKWVEVVVHEIRLKIIMQHSVYIFCFFVIWMPSLHIVDFFTITYKLWGCTQYRESNWCEWCFQTPCLNFTNDISISVYTKSCVDFMWKKNNASIMWCHYNFNSNFQTNFEGHFHCVCFVNSKMCN